MMKMKRILKKLLSAIKRETWEKQCDRLYCSKCERYKEHEQDMCCIEYTTGKCFVAKENT